jgi:MinD-like ATPase involved in chromosome partitioning or flagellar assembly
VVVVLVVAAGAAWESHVLELLGARPGVVVLKRCVDVDELLGAGSAGQADVAVVALEAPGLDHAAVELLHRHGLRVVAVAGGSGEAARARATRIGVDALAADDRLDRVADLVETDLVETDVDAAEGVRELVADTNAGPAPPARATGSAFAVWGPAGAPGRTTVATGLAASFARRGQRTTLVDADPYGGAVAQHLGILDEVSGLLSASRFSADGVLEDRFAAVQRSIGDRFTVVTGLPRADRWREVRAGVVERLLDVARRHGQVVVDTGFSLEDEPMGDLVAAPSRNQLTLSAVDLADEVVVVGGADPVGLSRLARALVELRERRPGVAIRVVVNRMRPGLGWSEREIVAMVEGFARVTGVHFLPDDRVATDRALVAGRSVAESDNGALARGLADLAAAMLPASPPAHAGERRRRWSRR